MTPLIFFVLSIGVNIIVVYYLINYYYNPVKLTGPHGIQGKIGKQGNQGRRGPKGDKWKFESCDDISSLLTEIKDVLVPEGKINQRCLFKIWNDNKEDVIGAISRTERGNQILSNI